MSTSNLTFFGIGDGYNVWKEVRFRFTPDLRLGYFRVSEIFQSLNNSFLIRKSIEPGLNFSYLLNYSLNGDSNQHDLSYVSPRVFCTFCKKVIKKYFFKEMPFLCI